MRKCIDCWAFDPLGNGGAGSCELDQPECQYEEGCDIDELEDDAPEEIIGTEADKPLDGQICIDDLIA